MMDRRHTIDWIAAAAVGLLAAPLIGCKTSQPETKVVVPSAATQAPEYEGDGSIPEQRYVIRMSDGQRDWEVQFPEVATGYDEGYVDADTAEERCQEVATILSHDVVNKLHIAEGNLELVREEHESDHLNRAAETLIRVQELIDDMVRVLRSGDRLESPEEVNLEKIAQQAWQTIQTPQADLSIGETACLMSDPSGLQELLENLFQNAVEHGGPDVSIHVGLCENRSGFYVADDGPGFQTDNQEKIFRPGYTTSEESTGVGLQICRSIADAHGWKIQVLTRDDGGARINITGVEIVE
ncbi:MAG: sensor histidine kinase [Bradymonadaceae bacterium]